MTWISPHEEPLGSFLPGRYAWLLADVAPATERCPWCWGKRPTRGSGILICPVCKDEGRCDPIPARGRQGLWEWDPATSAAA